MSWRVVVISQRCKLDYSMNYMVVRGEETKRVLLDEMAVLILENNAISMTGYLLSELIERKIKVILCRVGSVPVYRRIGTRLHMHLECVRIAVLGDEEHREIGRAHV